VCVYYVLNMLLKMPARNTINNGVRYSKLASDDDGYIDLQVRKRGF